MTREAAELRLHAEREAARSGDTSTKVGAAMLSPGGVYLAARNDIPEGVEDRPERRERPTKYLFTAHAEEALVSEAARLGVSMKDSTVYVTATPCAPCARMLRNAGVRRLILGSGTWRGSQPECRAASAAILEGMDVVRCEEAS